MARSPILEPPSWVERRARRIADPVERLRFLRKQMRGKQPRRSRSWHVASMVACLVVMIAIVPLPTGTAETFAKERHLVVAESKQPPVAVSPQRVWLVERSGYLELYSNGLRIDVTFAVSNRPRNRFPIFSLEGGAEPVGEGNTPVGIVYHTTESNLAPFEEDENRHLQRLGRNLMEWVRQDRSYHYVIDRFGRVYRVVQEGDAA